VVETGAGTVEGGLPGGRTGTIGSGVTSYLGGDGRRQMNTGELTRHLSATVTPWASGTEYQLSRRGDTTCTTHRRAQDGWYRGDHS
jgi:hypothetical protein